MPSGLTYAQHPIRVLGVDPGLTRCGLGVVDGAPGRAPRLVRVGFITTPAGDDIASRLLRVGDPPRPADAADALALAICHIWRGGGAGLRLAALTGRGGSAS